MTSTINFFEFVQENYDVELQEDPLWHILAQTLDGEGHYEKSIMDFLIHSYPKLVRDNPHWADVTNDLFTALMVRRAFIAEKNFQVFNTMSELFESWTQSGTYDPDVSSISRFSPSLLNIFRTHENSRYALLDMIYQSPVLWTLFKSDIFHSMNDAENEMHAWSSFQHTIHRHAPERTDFYDTNKVKSMYMRLCGSKKMSPLPLEKMKSVLVGPHNNAMAWGIALQACVGNDKALPEKWLQMLPTFSSVHLNPNNPESWFFWHSLCKCIKEDVSGQELLAIIAKEKLDMSQAFETIWGFIDTFYEDENKYELAAQIHATAVKKDPIFFVSDDLYIL